MIIALRLAWRNIWRQPVRTLLTLAAIMVTVAVLVFFIAVQLSTYDLSINSTVAIFPGHLQIQPKGYLDKAQIRNTLKNPLEIQAKLQNFDQISGSAIRAFGFALASSDTRSFGTQIVGVQPNNEAKVSTIPGVVKEGRYLIPDDGNHAVIGKRLAQKLKLSIGQDLTLMGQAKDGSLAATVLTITGVFQSGANELDGSLVEIPLTTFQEVFSMGKEAHSIVIKSLELQKVADLKQQLETMLQDYSNHKIPPVALTWDEVLPGLKQSIEFDMASSWLFYISLVIVVAFTVMNTFLMSVLERTREFGTMSALGATPFRIAVLIYLESVMLVLVGLVLGIGLGSAVTLYFNIYGLYIPGGEAITEMWNLPVVFHPRLNFRALALGPVIVFVISMLAVIYPVFKIWKLKPVEALRAT